jgi:hypothetical protein
MSRALRVALVCVAVAIGSRTAGAEEKTSRDVEWYGDQVLLVDVLSWGAILAAFPLESEPVAITGLTGLVVGGPIVHAANGHPGRAGLSLAARTAAPALAFFIGVELGKDDPLCGTKQGEPNCGFMTGLYAAGATLVAAEVVDALFLSRGRRAAARTADTGAKLNPIVTVQPGGAAVGIGGAF